MVINQFHSIGDILFIEPICRYYRKQTGEKPILPVRDHLMWMSEYIESARFVKMSEFKLNYDSLDTRNPDYLPLRFANQIVRKLHPENHSDYENCMPDKYILADLNTDLWQSLDIKFKMDKGLKLYNQLGLTRGEEYVLVNENSQAGKVRIRPATNKRVINMQEVPGFTVIDWFYVILNAKENHHVSTSTFYLFQAICNKFDFKSKIFIYPRPNEDGLRGISKLKTTFKYSCE